ncbi:isoprenylcysteine carboxyl methyltransferase family protein [Staphylospora marina]|uniref:isoprenylcysteine carboxyl methyltransferase family protein n=1 Tax=Staphylospora marina TaxID=2490858 RepID=UPI001F155CD8|nr:isoprenylcysteine carboxylmethyltransferase family protein [Staphylospora marina]
MSDKWFWLLWSGLAIQRLLELSLSGRNRRWMESRGGWEAGREHYPLIVGVHLLFFAGMLVEVWIGGARPPDGWPIPFLLFLTSQALRLWCIRSLGPCWNTRIMVMPGHPLVKSGPYRYLRHPNYLAVAGELLFFPMMFGAFWTMILVSMLNAALLVFVRIPAEERALRTATGKGRAEPGR